MGMLSDFLTIIKGTQTSIEGVLTGKNGKIVGTKVNTSDPDSLVTRAGGFGGTATAYDVVTGENDYVTNISSSVVKIGRYCILTVAVSFKGSLPGNTKFAVLSESYRPASQTECMSFIRYNSSTNAFYSWGRYAFVKTNGELFQTASTGLTVADKAHITFIYSI